MEMNKLGLKKGLKAERGMSRERMLSEPTHSRDERSDV